MAETHHVVRVGSASTRWGYNVHIGSGLVDSIPSIVFSVCPSSSKVVIVSDANVALHYAVLMLRAFESEIQRTKKNVKTFIKLILAGEPHKNRDTKADIEDWMLAQGCGRDTVLIALGGGVVGDLVGYVASTYMRGVPVVQVPTSLLAMVDSSVGGKTGIDTQTGKNLVGAFHQPKAVIADMCFLRTLPQRELINGMAEVIKAGAILDADLFQYLESHADAIVRHRELDKLLHVIRRAVEIKARVVSEDEFEGGLRAVLNFGHSVGHAIEALVQPDLLHGECVAIGMVLEMEIGLAEGLLCSKSAIRRLRSLLSAYGLPVDYPLHLDVHAVLDKMAVDKKNAGGVKHIVLLEDIGVVAKQPVIAATSATASSTAPASSTSSSISSSISSSSSSSSSPSSSLSSPAALSNSQACDHVVAFKYTFAVADNVILVAIAPFVSLQPIAGVPPINTTLASINDDAWTPPPSTSASSSSSRVLSLDVPGSKSLSNRALLLAALGKGPCVITGLLHSQDTEAMITCLRELGVVMTWHKGDTELHVVGANGVLKFPNSSLYMNNAGTAARFLTSAVTLVRDAPTSSSSSSSSIRLCGSDRMHERPVKDLVDALQANGATISYAGARDDALPLSVTPSQTAFSGGDITVSPSISSQFVSSLLLSAPYAKAPVRLTLAEVANDDASSAASGGRTLVPGKVVSRPYIQMTVEMMEEFGVKVEEVATPISSSTSTAASAAAAGGDSHALSVPTFVIPRQGYVNPSRYQVQGDASSATYPWALAAVTGMSVTVPNVTAFSTQQGDSHIPALLAAMGCSVVKTSPTSSTSSSTSPSTSCVVTVSGPSPAPLYRNAAGYVVTHPGWAKWMDNQAASLSPSSSSSCARGPFADSKLGGLVGLGDVDMNTMTDAFLSIAVVAALARGPTVINNIANQRVKECDRIKAVTDNLRRAGFVVTDFEDGLRIYGLLTQEELDQVLTSQKTTDAASTASTISSASPASSTASTTTAAVVKKEKKKKSDDDDESGGAGARVVHTEAARDGFRPALSASIASTESLSSSSVVAGNGDGLRVVDCHNDHRVSMSFAILATRLPYLVIQDKACVAKTFPTFWHDIRQAFNVAPAVPTRGALLPPPPLASRFPITGPSVWGPTAQAYYAASAYATNHSSPSPSSSSSTSSEPGSSSSGPVVARRLGEKELEQVIAKYTHRLTMCPTVQDSSSSTSPSSSTISKRPPLPSVVIIGMRASGKTHMGRALAHTLGCLFIDIDEQLSHYPSISAAGGIKPFVEANGWPAFREAELKVFSDVVQAHGTDCVIACGGGIVETEAAREMLREWTVKRMNVPPSAAEATPADLSSIPVVVHLTRHESDIDAALSADTSRPSLTSHASSTSSSSSSDASSSSDVVSSHVSIMRRRMPLYRSCSLLKFAVAKGDLQWPDIQRDFVRFVCNRLDIHGTLSTGPIVQQPILREGSFFLSLTMDLTVPHTPPSAPIKSGTSITLASAPALTGCVLTPSLPVPPPAGSEYPSQTPTTSTSSTTASSSASASTSFPLVQAAAGVDALELRADLLHDTMDRREEGLVRALEVLHKQLQYIRRYTPHLPVIYTLRSAAEGGKFAGSDDDYLAIVSSALRLGFDYVDIEARWSLATRMKLARQAVASSIRIISSFHAPHDAIRDRRLLRARFLACADFGGCPVEFVKVVTRATDPADAAHVCAVAADIFPRHSHIPHGKSNRLPLCSSKGPVDMYNLYRLEAAIRRQVAEVSSSVGSVPFREESLPGVIALAMGNEGKLSRVAGQTMCPVTSALLASAAAPGQMTVEAVTKAREALGLVSHKRFFIYGNPVTYSPSPPMHQAVWDAYALPWGFERATIAEGEGIASLIQHCGSSYGGGCVTIPLKQAVMPLLTALDPACKAMGACNTIVLVPDEYVPPASATPIPTGSSSSSLAVDPTSLSLPVLLGYNTDWIGVAEPVGNALAAIRAETLSRGHVCSSSPDSCCSTSNHSSSSSSRAEALSRQGVAVVVGAGGTARAALFALGQLGYTGNRLIVYNRSVSEAAKLAAEFKCTYVSQETSAASATSFRSSASSVDHTIPTVVAPLTLKLVREIANDAEAFVDVLVSTVPGAAGFFVPPCIVNQMSPSSTSSSSTSPPSDTSRPRLVLPVVMDVAYLPKKSSVLEHAKAAGLVTLTGVDMLLAQGRAQSRLWTGKVAGFGAMSACANAFYDALPLP